mgnify:FL=1
MQTLGATGTLRWHAKDILDTRGFAGLYRAVLPTTLRAGILTASQLGVYDHAKHTCVHFCFFLRRKLTILACRLMVDFPGVFREGFWTHAAASGIAGFACSAASSPGELPSRFWRCAGVADLFAPLVDVVKVRSLLLLDPSASYFIQQVRIMSDSTGQYKNAVHCAALLLKNEGADESSLLCPIA